MIHFSDRLLGVRSVSKLAGALTPSRPCPRRYLRRLLNVVAVRIFPVIRHGIPFARLSAQLHARFFSPLPRPDAAVRRSSHLRKSGGLSLRAECTAAAAALPGESRGLVKGKAPPPSADTLQRAYGGQRRATWRATWGKSTAQLGQGTAVQYRGSRHLGWLCALGQRLGRFGGAQQPPASGDLGSPPHASTRARKAAETATAIPLKGFAYDDDLLLVMPDAALCPRLHTRTRGAQPAAPSPQACALGQPTHPHTLCGPR
jgi:hypothetical protein